MSQRVHEPARNLLLARLSAKEYGRLLTHLEHVNLALGEVIYESGGQQRYIYFPTTVIISLLYMMENGSSAEIGVAGKEGLVGIALFMGGGTVPNRAVVQSAGDAFRMKTNVLQDEFAVAGLMPILVAQRKFVARDRPARTAVTNRARAIRDKYMQRLGRAQPIENLHAVVFRPAPRDRLR